MARKLENHLHDEFIKGPFSFVLSWDKALSKDQIGLMFEFFKNCEYDPQDRPKISLERFTKKKPKAAKKGV